MPSRNRYRDNIEYYRKYSREHSEQKKEYGRQWRLKHPEYTHQERLKEYWKEYRKTHKEKIKEGLRRWRETHPEYNAIRNNRMKLRRKNAGPDDPMRKVHRVQQAKWKAKNPERIKIYNLINNHPDRYPLAETCEFCEETERLVRHHPDYDYPEIYVTCCSVCHWWIQNR